MRHGWKVVSGSCRELGTERRLGRSVERNQVSLSYRVRVSDLGVEVRVSGPTDLKQLPY